MNKLPEYDGPPAPSNDPPTVPKQITAKRTMTHGHIEDTIIDRGLDVFGKKYKNWSE